MREEQGEKLTLKDVAPLLRKLTYGETLTAEETRKAFNVIGDEDTESYYYLALTFGLMTRGPTVDELYGVCLDRADRVRKILINVNPEKIMDISGGGGGKISTFNVSTTVAFIITAGGVYVAKQAAPAVTGFTGSRDVLSEIGVDIPFTNGNPNVVKDCLEKIGIALYYYTAFSSEQFRNFLKWRDTIRRISLGYLTPWHIVSFVYSLVEIKNRVYGLFTDKYLRTLAELFHKFEYNRALVVHGIDGIDEVSNVGPTKVCELRDDRISEYTITPEDLGVRKAKPEEIKAVSREGNIIDFLKVIYGVDKGAKRDLAAVNAGAGFYIMGKAKTLKEGTQLAISLLDAGSVAAKLEALVAFFRNQEKLENWKRQGGVR